MDPVAPVPGKAEQGPFLTWDAALPAAGAYTNQTYTTLPPEARRLSLVASYTLGAGGTNGQASFRLQWLVDDGSGAGVVDIYEPVIDGTTISKADPFLINPQYCYEVHGPIVAAGTLSWRLLEVSVPVKARGFRVIAAENGDAVHPGTLTVRGYTSDRV